MTAALAAGLELTPLEEDTARFVDRRIGLSIVIPGRPRLAAPAPTTGGLEPTCEAVIALADAPVTIRYRVNDLPPGATPDLRLLAETYGANRCRREDLSRAQPASPEQCHAWGVERGASTIYPLAAPDDAGDDMEEVLVVARERWLVTLTKRFCRERMSWVTWALCNSAIAAGIRWDPAALDATPPPLWPPSTFLRPGVVGTLAAARRADAARLAELAAAHSTASVQLADAVEPLVRGGEPPTHPIASHERATFEAYLTDRAGAPALASAIAALLAEVQTAHDLRGLALLVLHAVGRVAMTFASSSDDDRRAFGHVAE